MNYGFMTLLKSLAFILFCFVRKATIQGTLSQ